MEWYFILWIVIGILVIVSGVFYAGFTDDYNSDQVIFSSIVVALLLPFLICIAILILIAPFAGIYYLGRYIGDRK